MACRLKMRMAREMRRVRSKYLSINFDIVLIRSIRFQQQFVMSETESSYDFDHFTEESLPAPETFLEDSHHEEQEYNEEVQSYHLRQHSQYNEPSAYSRVDPPISCLQSTFEQLDKDGKGVITKSVLKKATMITSDQYDRRIIKEEIDKCDKEINYSRFVQIFEMANVGDRGVNEWLYSLYDFEQKGFIGAQDLQRVAEITGIELSEQQIEQMLVTERNCGSGKVDYDDFKYIMEEEIQYM